MTNRRSPATKPMRKYKQLPIHVVDEHDGSMVCTLRAIEQGYVPGRGVKLLHFDSHPDLGCIEKTWRKVDTVYHRDYSIRDLYSKTDIATWITPMSLMGHIDFVCWACAYWCDQFPVGKWDLLVGKDKNDGRIKVGVKGDKKLSCLEYWDGDGSVCNEADFEYCREWTLMVVRYGRNCRLSDTQTNRIINEFSSGPWVLDIDEDFFSCNNPYFDKFRDLFGDRMHKVISKVYNIHPDEAEVEEKLLKMFKRQSYKKSWNAFSKTALTRDLKKGMQDSGKDRALQTFHKFLRDYWPNSGGFKKDDKKGHVESSESESDIEDYEVANFFSLDDLHNCGQLSMLPHHISTAKEIKTLMNEVDDLFDQLPRPNIITVATSRLDRYLPDSQASLIHGFLECVLASRYDTTNVLRLDKPQYSVDNRTNTKELAKNAPKPRFVTDILN